jgi:glycolate oxidase iron-sulfur subunit
MGALAYTPHRAEGENCCGALGFHLGHQAEALASMRRNIDAWWPYVEGTVPVLQGQGVEVILANSSGCGATIRNYADYLREDPAYAEKAQRISDLFRDPIEWLCGEIEPLKARIKAETRLTLHEPCSLQHGLQLKGRLETFLAAIGCEVRKDAAPELCCGAGGAYSLLYPELSGPLRAQKRRDLGMGVQDEPAIVVSSNIGCLQYLSTPEQPVLHWLEWLAHRLDEVPRELQSTLDSPRE